MLYGWVWFRHAIGQFFFPKKKKKKKITSESFDNDNKRTLKSLFAFCSDFLQGPIEERWKQLWDRHSVRFPEYSRAKKS